jgi:hypothetical protein
VGSIVKLEGSLMVDEYDVQARHHHLQDEISA